MKKLFYLFAFVALLICQSCNNKNEAVKELDLNGTIKENEAQKNFESIETVLETLRGEPMYLSADGKCLVAFLDSETVEVDKVNRDGELEELFKSHVLISKDSNDKIVLLFGDIAEFTPEELTIYGESTYTDFNQYTPKQLMEKGINL